MIESPISIVAWLAVVIVQAVIHFVVFGARRERLQKEEEALFETLSLSTSASFSDQDAAIFHNNEQSAHRFETQVVALAAAATSSSSLLDDLEEDEDEIFFLERSAASEPLLNCSPQFDDDDDLVMEEPPSYLLMQTGKDILRRGSLEKVVEEQIRAIPQ
ncbi:hypothetical protein IV203_037799 [Nitzschia inconspicua]|uniref:Uncharacterized protein n=1 Tax=Nitzschia inconspicua TaxID=303405 RepID=A0A9K3LM12_9STRA|nr:hypothetical protein IV203_037799 [Nitzschia inconspicua]